MPSTAKARFGFIGWNPFQYLHSLDIAKALDGSVMIIEKRADFVSEFSDELLLASDVPVLIWDKDRMGELDGLFDVVVCQTIFTQIERFERSKLAMLQYGLAKEPHNHGAWRSLSDLTLVYGPYTAQKMQYFCPVAEVGNPRFDKWGTQDLAARAQKHFGHLVDPSLKTILYLPTWGDLSTQELYMEQVIELGQRYNVLIKLHHNTDLLEKSRTATLVNQRVHHLGANDDTLELLTFADVVLSDYSGAIFDALYCEKPVVLLQQVSDQRFGAKLDAHSLEYAAQSRIGPVVERPADLDRVVDDVLLGQRSFREENAALVRELFVPSPGATERAVAALLSLSRGEVPPLTQLQSYVRDEVRRSRLDKFGDGAKAAAKKKPKRVQK